MKVDEKLILCSIGLRRDWTGVASTIHTKAYSYMDLLEIREILSTMTFLIGKELEDRDK